MQLNIHLLWIYGLTVLGGFFNAGAILLHARPASHHTGNLSGLALALFDAEIPLVKELLAVMLAYIAGAAVSGFLFHDRKFKPSSRYGILLLLMGVLLGTAALRRHESVGLLFLGAGFMGVQNGLFIYYRNILFRTTHVTGTFTDFGFALGGLSARGPGGKRADPLLWSVDSVVFGGRALGALGPAGRGARFLAHGCGRLAVFGFGLFLYEGQKAAVSKGEDESVSFSAAKARLRRL